MALIPIDDYIAQQWKAMDSMFPAMQPPGPDPANQPGFVSNAFQRGVKGVQADYTNAAALGAQALGFDEISQGLYDKAKEYADARDAIPRRVPRMEDINSMSDLGVFAMETLVENAPMLASIAVPGGLVAKGVGLAGAAAGSAEFAGALAGFLSDVGLQTAEDVELAKSRGQDPLDMRVIGTGIGKAVLDFVPMMTLARRMGALKALPLGPLVEKNLAQVLVDQGFLSKVVTPLGAKAIGGMVDIAAREIPTEVAQQALDIALDRTLTQTHGQLTDDEISQLKNAAAGAAAFSILGIPHGVMHTEGVDYDKNQREADELNDNAPTPPRDALPPPTSAGQKLLTYVSKDQAPAYMVDTEGNVTPYSQERFKALPRPPDFFVDSKGNAIPPGPQAVTTPYGRIPEGRNDLRVSIKDAMSQPEDQDTAMMLKLDHTTETNLSPDALNAEAEAAIALPAELRSPIDNATIITNSVVQDGKKKRQRKDAATPLPGDNTQGLAPELQMLLDQRNDVLADTSVRRKDNGELNAVGKKQVAAVENRIARMSEVLGVENPIRRDLDNMKSETELADFNREGAKPKVSNLSEGEQTYLAKLNEKDVIEGLTDTEYAAMERLMAKQRGDITAADEERAKKTRVAGMKLMDQLARAQDALQKEGLDLPDRALYGEENDDAHRRDDTTPNQPGSKAKYSVDDVTSAVQALMRGMPNAPHVVVAPNAGVFRDVPGRSRFVSEKNSIKGIFFQDDPNQFWIFSDRVESLRDLAKSILHEAFHFGIFRYMDPVERAQILSLIAKQRPEVFARVQQENPQVVEAAQRNPQDQRARRAFQQAMVHTSEEVIAERAETMGPNDKSFIDSVISVIRRMLRRIMPTLRVSDAEIRNMIRNVGAYNRQKSMGVMPRNYRTVLSEPFRRREFEQAAGRTKSLRDEVIPGIDELGGVWGQKFMNGVLTPLQIANSAFVKKTMPSVAVYLDNVQKWWARRMQLTKLPTELAEQWTSLGKRDSEKLARTMFEISQQSDSLNRRLTPDELKAIFKKNDLDPAMDVRSGMFRHAGSRNIFELWRDVDKSFQDIVNNMEKGLQVTIIRQAIRENIPNPVGDRARAEKLAQLWRSEASHAKFIDSIASAPDLKNLNLGARLLEVESQMQSLRNRNYFPRSRFGKYALTVRAKRNLTMEGRDYAGPTEGKAGEVVWFETHESPNAQRQGREALLSGEFGKASDYHVQDSRLEDNEFVFLGMPPALYETLRGELGLTPEQEERLKELYRKFSPGAAFLRHLIRRKEIAGFSTDAIRTYTSYMMNASNHLARVEFHQDMGDALSNVRREAKLPTNATRAGEVREYFAKHYKYLMNPGNDWARLRSLGFMWYLAFNAKSALVNLTQVPMVAYPFLAHHYGDKATFGALTKAYADVTKMRRGLKILDADADRDFARAISDGFIDESRATELAGLAEGDILQRLMPESGGSKLLNKVSYYGSFMFRATEKFNRETVFLAARELAKQKGLDAEGVYRAAREAVQTTMFEYAKWNRPEFMRGKKSTLFLFTNYMQHMAYLAYGGEGGKVALRIWSMLLLAAGIQGLPFAENFMDLFDFGSTEVKEMLGMKDPHTDLRADLRELANTLTDSPDLIMHGMSRYYGLGPMHFLANFDVPVPNVDVSGSIGAGDVIPGIREAMGPGDDPDAKLGKTLVSAFGPVVGIGYNLWRASVDDNPDTWKVWERAMPSAISSVSKAMRRNDRGAETFRGGGDVVEFAPQNMEQRMENIAQGFGFSPTRLDQRQELRYSQEQLKQYWVSRRAALMEGYAYAALAREPEAVDLAAKKIREFNSSVPSPMLSISQEKLHSSVKERYRQATLREHGIPAEKAFRPLYLRTESEYPEATAAIPTR